MTHWIVLPVVLPAMLAAVLVLVTRYHPVLQRTFSMAGTLGLLALALGLFWRASDGTIDIYQLGHWPAPFGIVLVADRLSTLMVLITATLAPLVLLYAIGSGWDKRGWHFHALFQFQLMGIMGAFLTGDLFNLFVFFEVLLIASYGLMIHAGGAARLRAGVQYVLYNLLGSTLFLFALGTIYAQTGTLNMADLALRVSVLSADDTGGIRVAAVLLLLVFAIKAALLPLHFWLPASYAEAPAPVAALFSIMTKVGAYGIIRVYTLIFPPTLETTQGLMGTWLLPAAVLTLAMGMIGVLGAARLDRLVAFSVIGSMGMLLSAVGVFTPDGISAALYYAVHSTFAAAALFLLVDVLRDRRGDVGAHLRDAGVITGGPLIAGLFFVAAIVMTGLPPLSGFVGKLLVMQSAWGHGLHWWVWGAVLGGSLIAVVGFARAGSQIFWRSHQVMVAEVPDGDTLPPVEAEESNPDLPAPTPPRTPVVAIGGVIAVIVGLTIFAGPVTATMQATADQLFTPAPYIDVVLNTEGKQIPSADYADTPDVDLEEEGY
ncbi:monovalent cation/H+ antiporter subunit D [Salipiger sp. IMCC34102]|uniref:monovalent cation/H+ antiporter subunit D n=1 Tax=Salipiger sp. IMCC34102 TaxID=2510647 RepID=UPI00101D2DE6|nr:monovalent cation/H+ antiporter subunit D [Salipiger sp. IMCC34102]RYH01279.1 monovalent cation/H+ antiporter subunit D [Salipiger sp. IMCC34102]